MFIIVPLRGHLLYTVDMDTSHPEKSDSLTSCRGYDEHTVPDASNTRVYISWKEPLCMWSQPSLGQLVSRDQARWGFKSAMSAQARSTFMSNMHSSPLHRPTQLDFSLSSSCLLTGADL